MNLSHLPSVDQLALLPKALELEKEFGRPELILVIRQVLQKCRQRLAEQVTPLSREKLTEEILKELESHLITRSTSSFRRVINLTGTVLHTNLGRATLPAEAIAAMVQVAEDPCALEYDLGEGKRGDRDDLVEELLCELTGAEAATLVNNNAAAVFLLLNTLSNKKETIVSRGELIEIGGSFRIPDIMQRAGAKLKEVGTTNRTHAKDFIEAISSKTSLIMKIHTSNYVVEGFTASVPEIELAAIAKLNDLPFVVDLGSGTLIDMTQYGLPKEATPKEAIRFGADLVSFSGDKLLGGPQVGILVGSKKIIQKIKKNPLKRVLRTGKITLAALEAVLRLYRDPAKLQERLPILKMLTRSEEDIADQAKRLLNELQRINELLSHHGLELTDQQVKSQIGSGSLPVELLASIALKISGTNKSGDKNITKLERLLRASHTPVIGRLSEKSLLLDLRCLKETQEQELIQLLAHSIGKL